MSAPDYDRSEYMHCLDRARTWVRIWRERAGSSGRSEARRIIRWWAMRWRLAPGAPSPGQPRQPRA